MVGKVSLVAAPLLLDRGTWVRADGNSESFTPDSVKTQLSDSPLDYLEQLSLFQKLKRECTYLDLSQKIGQLQSEFAKRVFEGKKEKFWSYVADGYIEKYVSEVEKAIRVPLRENRPFLAIGGSHTIGWPVSKAIFNQFNSMRDKISIIFFDEHEDDYAKDMQKIRPTMYHGSWAEVVRRNFGCTPFHIKPENFDSGKLEKELKGKKFLYLSVDVDVFDLEHAPSTFYALRDPTFSVGTMDYDLWKRYLGEIKQIADENYVKILGADLSEFVPYGHTEGDNKITAEHSVKLLSDLHELVSGHKARENTVHTLQI